MTASSFRVRPVAPPQDTRVIQENLAEPAWFRAGPLCSPADAMTGGFRPIPGPGANRRNS